MTQTTNILLLPRVENLLPRPRDSSKTTDSFSLGFPVSTSTPTCVSLSFYCSNLINHQALDIISFLIILSMCEGNYLQISQNIHTHSKQSHLKNVANISLLYQGQYIKPYTSYGLSTELKILQKKQSKRLSIDQV